MLKVEYGSSGLKEELMQGEKKTSIKQGSHPSEQEVRPGKEPACIDSPSKSSNSRHNRGADAAGSMRTALRLQDNRQLGQT